MISENHSLMRIFSQEKDAVPQISRSEHCIL
jgi:hypothetical protein